MAFARRKEAIPASEFKNLYNQHLTAVFNFCLYRVGDTVLAEDITADTFERAWLNRYKFDPEKATFTTWLFSIARNRVTDHLRWHGRRSIVELNDHHPDKSPPLEERAAVSERNEQLMAALGELTADQQELIALKFGAGMTNRAIADVVDKSESAVGSALHRALDKIRQELTETEISIN